MSSLREKLKELGVQIGTSQIQTPSTKAQISTSLIDILPGEWESTNQGDCFVVRKFFPLGKTVGQFTFNGSPDLGFFESLNHFEGISGVKPNEYLFIDTETTGLSGGVGNYVFLIGAAKFDDDSLIFSQFFLQDPASEAAQLAALESFTASTKAIISYNGKSFDLPRIKTRYRFHGWPDPFDDVYHIDLLHIARRLWKSHLPGCSLGDLEHHLLGLIRDNLDIPGWQVSEYFFEYLRSGDPSPLESIFYHNEIDVLSLVALLDYITDRLASPLSDQYQEAHDLVSIGKYMLSLRLLEESQEVLTVAISNPTLPEHLLIEGKLSLASIHKLSGNYHLAAPLWKECADLGSVESLIELAKYAEHKIPDYDEAIHWTLSAMQSVANYPDTKQTILLKKLTHRLDRLKKKAKR